MAHFLGLDCSTQSLTAVIIDTVRRTVVHQHSVVFDDIKPGYGSINGVLPNDDSLVKRSNPLMWVAALDQVLSELKAAGADLGAIAGISGSGQQHGTVYLDANFQAGAWLQREAESLVDAVRPHLRRPESPIWMDSSTFEDCRRIDAALSGAMEVRRRTGSSATERFAGPQISAFARQEPKRYQDTAVIHLVSSFFCALLTGASAPIDHGDGAGMNLMNLQTLSWDRKLLEATAPGLRERLPELCPSDTVVGVLHPYFQRYGFREGVPVAAWSGDNPSSLIGVGGWKPGTMVISLGTSDTYFAAMEKPAVDPQGYGHVFGNPAGGFMSLICFKNGSLARERIRQQFDLSWPEFDCDAFELTVPGNHGNLMLPYFTPEITPLALNVGPIYEGNRLFKSHKDAAAIVRALVEAQALTMRLHSQWIGHRARKLRVTGGASVSDGICRVLADVFNATVERLKISDSGALGAAMRAAHAVAPQEFSWSTLTRMFTACDSCLTIKPIPANAAIYDRLLPDYAALEYSITRS